MASFHAKVELVRMVTVTFEAEDDEAPAQVALRVARDSTLFGGSDSARIIEISRMR